MPNGQDGPFLSSSMVERSAVNRNVVGSNPTWGASFSQGAAIVKGVPALPPRPPFAPAQVNWACAWLRAAMANGVPAQPPTNGRQRFCPAGICEAEPGQKTPVRYGEVNSPPLSSGLGSSSPFAFAAPPHRPGQEMRRTSTEGLEDLSSSASSMRVRSLGYRRSRMLRCGAPLF